MGDEENRKGPDEVIYEIGGCGRFQIRIATVIHSMTIIVVWTIQLMFFVGASPTWWCTNGSNTTYTANNTLKETCIIQNGTECSTFEFSDDMHTIVNEVSYCRMKEVTEL